MNRSSSNSELIAVASVFVLATAYTVDSLTLKLGNFTSPGSGLFPLITGIILLVLTGLRLVLAFAPFALAGSCDKVMHAPNEDDKDLGATETSSVNLTPELISMALCVIFYPFVIGLLDYVIATFSLTFPMLAFAKSKKKLRTLMISSALIAATITIISFFVFSNILRVNLPMGPVEIFLSNIFNGGR